MEPHKGRGHGQKREKRLREKMSSSLAHKFSLACRNGPFPALFLPSPVPQTGSGKFPLFTLKGLHSNASESWSLFLCGGLQSDDTHEKHGETIIEILCKFSYAFIIFCYVL